MIIINSAAYVNSEFKNEMGAIPPCLLPLGNKKLLSYQVQSLRSHFEGEDIFVSLPQSYQLSMNEEILIKELDIDVVFIPDGLSLGTALLYLLNTIVSDYTILRLLHGDTLLFDLPHEDNVITLSDTDENYEWEREVNLIEEQVVWCGYFAFSSVRYFIQALALSQGNFIEAVKFYKNQSDLKFVKASKWFDFGHINTYFKSRAVITTQRAFNLLKISNGIVWKSGSPIKKIQGEAEWFKNIPSSMKIYTPKLLNSGTTEDGNFFYELEYLPCLPLNELFVSGRNPVIFWKKILNKIAKFLFESSACFSLKETSILENIKKDARGLYEHKTYTRLNDYAKEINLDLNISIKYDGVWLPSINTIASECISKTLAQPVYPSILHGDLCFSNILFNSRTDMIKVIDPRGMNFLQEMTVCGDQKYDLAKVCHSIIGLYDFIISDLFIIKQSEDIGVKIIFGDNHRLDKIQKIFLESSFIKNFKTVEIIPLTILLFFSMASMHFENPNRQKAMIINGLRLYKEYIYI